MAATLEKTEPRVIVVPRPLEGYFYERLRKQFDGRDDVRIVVDRRMADRRRPHWTAAPGPLAERRRTERRAGQVTWSLAGLPPEAF